MLLPDGGDHVSYEVPTVADESRRPPGEPLLHHESGLRYQEVESGVLRCLDLDEDAYLPEDLAVGDKTYDDYKGA